jgi:putative DNA primase/helicase
MDKEKTVKATIRRPSDELRARVRAVQPELYEPSDKGNAEMFSDIFRGELRYNATAREWFHFDGKRWVKDNDGMEAERRAKELSDALYGYIQEIEDDAVRNEFTKRVYQLGNRRKRRTMIDDARDLDYIVNEDLDRDLYLLNVQNGVLDLRTFEFMPHAPELLLSKLAAVEYNPEASSAAWEKFIDDVMCGDKSKIEYLQKLLGYSLTGGTNEESCYLLYGASTRNGKSTFVETYAYMLGGTDGYAMTMRPETLAQKQNTDSRQASGDIARLDGCRFLNASEPPKRMIFDVALLKTLLGRDSITARHLHQSEFQFVPVFKLFINTNFLPLITDDTLFSSGRLNVITFDRHFEPTEQDRNLKTKLQEPEALSGLLNWCLAGLRKYYAEGAVPPDAIRASTAEYRASSDKIGNFIAECLEESTENSTVKDVYQRYTDWCKENGFGAENKSNFMADMKTKGLYAPRGTVRGKTCRNVIRNYLIGTLEGLPNGEKSAFD